MTKRRRRENSKRPLFKKGFTKIPRVFVDSAAIGAIGPMNFLVYSAIRRFERTDRSAAPAVTRLIDAGYLVSYVNQTTVAVLLGLSRSTVTRAIQLLKAVQWIKEVRLKDNGRAYKLGVHTNPDERGRTEPIYFADTWLEHTLAALPKKCIGWKHKVAERRRAALVESLQRVVEGIDDEDAA
jgi:hypothetical protein